MVNPLLYLSEEGDGARVFKAVLVDNFVTHFVQAVAVVGFVNCHFIILFSIGVSLLLFSVGLLPTDALRGREGLCPLFEPLYHFTALVTEADFFRATVLCALFGDRAEGVNKFFILGAVHYVGG